MITTKKGDIIAALQKGEIKSMVHGVNCMGGFGSGIAGQLAKKFPCVREQYLEVHNTIGWSLGFVDPVPIEENKWVFNAATQNFYGRNPKSQPNGMYCDYEAIRRVMLTLRNNSSTPYPLGIPKIGCGLAGGDWRLVKQIILDVFKESKELVIIYEY